MILDIDATDDETHGEQQLTLFHGHYGQYQYYLSLNPNIYAVAEPEVLRT